MPTYVGGQLEKAPTTGALHAHFLVQFERPIGVGTLKRWYRGYPIHVDFVRSINKARDYVTKTDTRVEGPWHFPDATKFRGVGQGHREDLEAFVRDVDAGFSDADLLHSYHVSTFAKYPHLAQHIRNVAKPKLEGIQLLPWQQQVVDLLRYALGTQTPGRPSRERHVFWFFETTGGVGKTLLTKWLLANMDAGLMPNKTDAAAFMYSKQPICIFDIPRSQQEVLNYGLVEQINNGVVLSTKYQPLLKLRVEGTIVVVFSNFLPEFAKLSRDRWKVYQIVKPNALAGMQVDYILHPINTP